MAYLENNFQWRSYRFDISTPATRTDSVSSPYLTPPPRLRHVERPPFKISASDNTSLSLKRRHHAKHDVDSQEEDAVFKGGLSTASDRVSVVELGKTARSRSLPCLPNRQLVHRGGSMFTSTQRRSAQGASFGRHRGWTLPAKSSSTRGLSRLHPVFKHHDNRLGNASDLTPAMITLKRATTNLSQITNITFFPPPKFERTRSGLISSFLNTIAGDGRHFRDGLRESGHTAISETRSDLDKSTQTVDKNTIEPTVTQVTVDPIILDVNTHDNPFRRRRCSTRYVAGSSIHEVIWDENDTPSSNSDNSPVAETVQDSRCRKPSVAVAQLETQLTRSIPRLEHMNEVDGHTHQGRSTMDSEYRWSFPDMLNLCLSRLHNEAALWNLPRSKAFKSRMRSNSSVVSQVNIHQTLNDSRDLLSENTAQFPPFHIHQESDAPARGMDVTSGLGWNGLYVDPVAQQLGFDTMYQQQSKHQDTQRRYGLRRTSLVKRSMARNGLVVEPASTETAPLLHPADWQEHTPW